MKIKSIIIGVGALLASVAASFAQAPQQIESVIVSGKDSAWYAQQADAWDREVRKTPQSEHAWRNLFEAKWYLHNWFKVKPEVTDSSQLVIKRMERAIPGSFTYNLCRLRMQMSTANEYGERALDMVPDELHPMHVGTLISYMWFAGYAERDNDRSALLNQLLRRQYEAGYYPDFALRFSYNQLEAMPSGAIYIGHGDLDLFPKLMMQRAMGLHADKTLIVNSFIHNKAYADKVCERLGIKPYEGFKEAYTDEKDASEAEAGFIRHIARETGRSVYCGAGVDRNVESLARNIYSEGIVFKYSEKPYNNVAATKKALEQKYHLEYLTEPKFRAETYWKGSEMLQVNYVVGLAHLVKSYREEGNLVRANWLYVTLRASVENTRLPEDVKRQYIGYLDSQK